jgi:two-component system chemotaxis response regulator CheY
MSNAQNLKILIVDDTSTSRMLVRDSLQELGFRNIMHAGDGEQALKMMMTDPAHLVISDFHMPKLDGLGLLQQLRAYRPTYNVPFIMLTGRGDKAVLEKAIKLGLNNYIPKPFTLPILKKSIEAVIGKL